MKARTCNLIGSALLLATFLLCGPPLVFGLPFVLNESTADFQGFNPKSDFYKVENLDKSPKATGSGAELFKVKVGSVLGLGDFVEFTWGENLKPFLTGAGLKAGGRSSAADGLYAMIWGEDVFATFNASNLYTAIRVFQDGIVHKKHSDNYLGISHVTFEGREGSKVANVPDSGSALALLAMGLAGLLLIRKRGSRSS